MPGNDDWLTVQDACSLTGYAEQYIRRLLRNNSIEGQKFGHVWMISRKSLLVYQAEAQQKSGQDKRYSPKNPE